MSRRRLNLNALRAFECAARQRSFSRAADELCVTHAAVSHQIKTLEQQLDKSLFTRMRNGVELTDVGRYLQPVLSESLDKIEAALATLKPEPTSQHLRITATSSFASAWLVPRLSGLRELAPELQVELLPTLDNVDFSSTKVDVGIRCGIPPWPDLVAELLMPIHLLPVCSPELMQKYGKPASANALLDWSLVHADIDQRPLGEEWQIWFRSQGVEANFAESSQSFRDPALAMNAALNGYGVAMGYQELVADDLRSGRLVAPFNESAEHPFSYYLVYPQAMADDHRVRTFKQWVIDEIRGGRDETAIMGADEAG